MLHLETTIKGIFYNNNVRGIPHLFKGGHIGSNKSELLAFFFGSKIRLNHRKTIKEVKERHNIISVIEPYRDLRYPISIKVVL